MTTPLEKFDKVHLFANGPQKRARVTGELIDESEIEYAGQAGFKVREEASTYWWFDRGKTWSSQKLDHIDETRKRFSQATKTENERNP